MPINTGMFAIAAAKYKDVENAAEYFRKLNASFGAFSPCSFPEIANNSQGCYLQAWSAAIYVESIVEGLLGIHAANDELVSEGRSFDALIGTGELRNLRFKGREYLFKF
ncbi:hypothetical protein [Thermoplasma sp.]|uniref:hypothetical protein n=1 Tax=Thermoplasma sp. TaxID=1973142 RepID=UPI002637F600|nr:hypothetical protein [Thermoplasma sp.]